MKNKTWSEFLQIWQTDVSRTEEWRGGKQKDKQQEENLLS